MADNLEVHTYPEATHGFDDPSGHDEHPENVEPAKNAKKRAKDFFSGRLTP